MENHHAINEKMHYKWSFSIAMLNYQRVYHSSHRNIFFFGQSQLLMIPIVPENRLWPLHPGACLSNLGLGHREVPRHFRDVLGWEGGTPIF